MDSLVDLKLTKFKKKPSKKENNAALEALKPSQELEKVKTVKRGPSGQSLSATIESTKVPQAHADLSGSKIPMSHADLSGSKIPFKGADLSGSKIPFKGAISTQNDGKDFKGADLSSTADRLNKAVKGLKTSDPKSVVRESDLTESGVEDDELRGLRRGLKEKKDQTRLLKEKTRYLRRMTEMYND
jgi:uncharacterized protein YjbI with pentapeptide repeats